MKTDLAIIGGGGAGFAAAAKANELGVKAVLINEGLPVGGTCVNVGCVPSKFLLEVGFDKWRAAHPKSNAIGGRELPLNFEQLIEQKREVVLRNRRSKYEDVLKVYKDVQLIQGRATFDGPGRVRVGDETVEAKNILICTGSSNRTLRLAGIEQLGPDDILDNIKAFELRKLPKSMIVLGGGPTGLEVAQMFSHFGTRITQVEAKDRVFAVSEPEVSHAVEDLFRSEGIYLHTDAKATRVRKDGQEVVLTVTTREGDKDLRAEKLFVAVGVAGNTQNLNLSSIGLETDRNGFIEVDERMRTQVPAVFAAGDVAGPPWLETLSAREGAVAVETAFDSGKMSINYDAVPSAVFIEPQLAVVGLTEDDAMERFGRCNCRTVELKLLPKADITGQTLGVAKMGIHPDTGKIIGFHLLAPHAAEIIHEAALAIQHQLSVYDIINQVHVFPSYSEIVKLCAQAYTRDITKMSCCVE